MSSNKILNTMVNLTAGDRAPVFKGVDQNGEVTDMKAYRGKKLVIFFYPEDDSPTCTEQACNLRDNFSILQDNGFEVIGISPDDYNSHKKFETKFSLPFRLVSDPEHKIMNKYGVWGEKQMFGHKFMGVFRRTFVIDEKGIIRKVFLRPKVRQHADEILKLVW